jgi:hypothetical protein
MTATLVPLATPSTLVRSGTLSTLVRPASPSTLVQMSVLPPPGRLENGFLSRTPRGSPTMRGPAGPAPSDAVQSFLGCLAVYGYLPL